MKREPKIRIELTRRQADLIDWALWAAIDQHMKFLMHDDWDNDQVPRSITKARKQCHAALGRAHKTFIRARGKAK